jgi:hypothetical protein
MNFDQTNRSTKLIEQNSLSVCVFIYRFVSLYFFFSFAYVITNQNRMRSYTMRMFFYWCILLSYRYFLFLLFLFVFDEYNERDDHLSMIGFLVCIWRVRRSYAAIQEMSRENRTIKCNLVRCH